MLDKKQGITRKAFVVAYLYTVMSYKCCLIWIPFFVSMVASAQDTATHWFTVKAFLPGWNGCSAQLLQDGDVLQSSVVADDMFSYIGKVSGIHQGLFQLKKEGITVTAPLFIEKGTIKIADKGFRQLLALGSPTNEAYQKVLQTISATALIRHGYDYDKVNNYKRELCIRYIKEHPASLVSLQLLKYYPFTRPDDSLYRALFSLLDGQVKATYLGQQMSAAIQQERVTAVGEALTNISLPDTLQQATPIYAGQPLTLIDFWASWCGPCRQQNRELVRLYNTYHPKGFTIVSISLDSDKTSWLKAINKDGLAWKQLSDLKGWESAAAKTFHVKAVPMNLLVDERGNIIARNLHVTSLQDILAKRLL